MNTIFRLIAEILSQARKNRQETGQGLVEYALILVLVAIVVIVILGMLGPSIGNILSNIVETMDMN